MSVALSLAAMVHGAAVLFLAGQGLHLLWLLWRFRRARSGRMARSASLTTDDVPSVLVQLPVYNERDVVGRLVECIGRLNWPRARLRIQLLDDSDDDTSDLGRAAIAQLVANGHDARQVRRSDRSGFKAGALAYGLALDAADPDGPAPFVAIFDADFLPEPDFLRRAVEPLLARPDVAFVQGRWEHLNAEANLLTRAQALGIDGHFGIEQAARAWSDLALNFNGTAGVWRLSAIEDAGGWQQDTLTEDLDLSYRAQLRGWRAHYLIDLGVPAELPETLEAWRTQQFRWAKGSIQTARKLLGPVWVSSWSLARKVGATLHLTHYFVHPCMLVCLVLTPFVARVHHDLGSMFFGLGCLIVAAGLLPPLLLYLVAARTLGRPWKTLIALPWIVSFGVGSALSNSMAVVGALLGRVTAFERTPKSGSLGKSYRGLPATGLAEIVLAGLGSLGLWFGTAEGVQWSSPVVAVYISGLFVQGFILLMHRIVEQSEGSHAPSLCREPVIPLGVVGIAATAFLSAQDQTWRQRPLMFAALGCALGVSCFVVTRLQLRPGWSIRRLMLVIGVGVILQFCALGLPISDDVNRYVLEGAQLAAGENPYDTSPAMSDARVDRDLNSRINHPEMTAIYPPLMLATHGVIGFFGATPRVHRWAALGAVLITALIIMVMLLRLRQPLTLVSAWLWNPVVVFFGSGEAHHDVIMTVAFSSALLALLAGRNWQSLSWAVAATLLKPFAIVALLPALSRLRLRGLAVVTLATTFAVLPFASAGMEVFSSFVEFSSEMHFHGFAEPAIRTVAAYLEPGLANPILARVGLGACLGIGVIWLRHRSRSDPELSRLGRCAALLLLVSPTIHPWYLTSLVVLLPFTRSRALLGWTVAAPLYWLHGIAMPDGSPWSEWPAATVLAHVPFVLWMAIEAFGPWRVTHAVSDARGELAHA